MKNSDCSVKGYSLEGMYNANEAKVSKMMEKMFDSEKYIEICTCGICLEDIFAISLNSLPPQYRHSSTVCLAEGKNQEKEIEAAIIEAIEKVRENPKHI